VDLLLPYDLTNKTAAFFSYRYLVVLYYQANKAFEKLNTQKKEEDLKKMKEKYDLKTPGRN
jgi:hypothetical protein